MRRDITRAMEATFLIMFPRLMVHVRTALVKGPMPQYFPTARR